MKEKLPKYISLAPNSNGKPPKKPYIGKFIWKNTLYHCGFHETIRAAQINVDKKRLELGLDTVILKRK